MILYFKPSRKIRQICRPATAADDLSPAKFWSRFQL